jgi:hypothetical protein
MKINEVLDSTESWATLKGISLEKYEDIESGYNKRLELIKTVHEVSETLTQDQTNAVMSNLKKQLDDYAREADTYANDLRTLGITNDADLNNKIAAIDSMKNNIEILSSKL